MKILKKIFLCLIGFLIFFCPSVLAEEIYAERYHYEYNGSWVTNVTIPVGQSKTLDIAYSPSDFTKIIWDDFSEDFDSSIASVSYSDDFKKLTITGRKVGDTNYTRYIIPSPTLGGKSGANLVIHVVELETDYRIDTSLNEIKTIFTGEKQSNLVTVTVKPENYKDFLSYKSSNTSVAEVKYSYGDYYYIYIVGVGNAEITFTVGDYNAIIYVYSLENVDQNFVDIDLPPNINKNTVKSAYETYIKQYNNPFQYGRILNCFLENTITSQRTVTSYGITVAENFHNFYRTILGLNPVTYTSAANKKAQIGADYMAKEGKMGHDIADDKDKEASEVLHSSNLTSGLSDSININIMSWFTDTSNVSEGGLTKPGHRLWMIDPVISEYGLAGNGFGAMYIEKSNRGYNKNGIYSVPSRGYFPIEAFGSGAEFWNIAFGSDYSNNIENIKVFVTYNNETIELAKDNLSNPNGSFNIMYGTGDATSINFYPKKFLADSKGNVTLDNLKDKTFKIRIEGLWKPTTTDGMNNVYVPCKPLEYTTHFFSIADEGWNPQIQSAEFIDVSTGKALTSPINMKVGETKTVKLVNVIPSTYSKVAKIGVGNYIYSELRSQRLDDTTFILTANSKVSGKLELSVYQTNFVKTYTVNISGSGSNQGTSSGGSTPNPSPNPGTSGGSNTPSAGSGSGSSSGGGGIPGGIGGLIPSVPSTPSTDSSTGNNSSTNKPTQKPSTPSQNPSSSTVPVYRIYNRLTGEHLYTTDKNEVSVLTKGDWNDEGIGWNAPTSGTAVYRLYSPVTGVHLFTTDKNEVNVLSGSGWSIDNSGKPLFYSGGSKSVYRMYNPVLRMHLITLDSNEYHTLPAHGWNQEGEKLKAQ